MGEGGLESQNTFTGENNGRPSFISRVIALAVMWSIALCGLLFKTYEIQIISGEQLSRLAQAQQSERVVISEPRGRILDRNGKDLLLNDTGSPHEVASRSIVAVFPSSINNPEAVTDFFKPYGADVREFVLRRLELGKPFFVTLDAKVSQDAKGIIPVDAQSIAQSPANTDSAIETPNQAASHYEVLEPTGVEGVVLVRVPERAGKGSLGLDLTGYIDPVLGKGVTGIENAMEPWLRGSGFRAVCRFLDGGGVPLKGLGYIIKEETTFPGHDVVLTLDSDLQALVEEAVNETMSEGEGAALVMNGVTGEVLAIAGYPRAVPLRTDIELDPDGASFDDRGYFQDQRTPVNMALRAYEAGFLLDLFSMAVEVDDNRVSGGLKASDAGSDAGPIASFKEDSDHSTALSELSPEECENKPLLARNHGVIDHDIIDDDVIRLAESFGFGKASHLGLNEEEVPSLFLRNNPTNSKEEPVKTDDDGEMMESRKEDRLRVNVLQMAQCIAGITENGWVPGAWCIKGIRYRNGPFALEFEPPRRNQSFGKGVAALLTTLLFKKGQSDVFEGINHVVVDYKNTSWCLGLVSISRHSSPLRLVVVVVKEIPAKGVENAPNLTFIRIENGIKELQFDGITYSR